MEEGKKPITEQKRRPVVTPDQLNAFEGKKSAFKKALESKKRAGLFDKFFSGIISDKELASIRKEVDQFLTDNPLKPSDVNVNRLIIAAKLKDPKAKADFFLGKLSWEEVAAKLAGKEVKPKTPTPKKNKYRDIPPIVQDEVPATDKPETPIVETAATEPPPVLATNNNSLSAHPKNSQPKPHPIEQPKIQKEKESEDEMIAKALGGKAVVDWLLDQTTIDQFKALPEVDHDLAPEEQLAYRKLSAEIMSQSFATPELLARRKTLQGAHLDGFKFNFFLNRIGIPKKKFRLALPDEAQWQLMYALYKDLRVDMSPEERKQKNIGYPPVTDNPGTRELHKIFSLLVAGAMTPEQAHQRINRLFVSNPKDFPLKLSKDIDKLLGQATRLYVDPKPLPPVEEPLPSLDDPKTGEFDLHRFGDLALAEYKRLTAPKPVPVKPTLRQPLATVIPPGFISEAPEPPTVELNAVETPPPAPEPETKAPEPLIIEPLNKTPELPKPETSELKLEELGLPAEKLEALTAQFKYFSPELDPQLIRYELLQFIASHPETRSYAKEDFDDDPDLLKIKARFNEFVPSLPSRAEQAYLDPAVMNNLNAGKALTTSDKKFLNDRLVTFLAGDRQATDREILTKAIAESRAEKSVNKKLLRLAEAALADPELIVVLPPKEKVELPAELAETELPPTLSEPSYAAAPEPVPEATPEPVAEIQIQTPAENDNDSEALAVENKFLNELAATPDQPKDFAKSFSERLLVSGLQDFILLLEAGESVETAFAEITKKLSNEPQPDNIITVSELDANATALNNFFATHPFLSKTGLTLEHLKYWAEIAGSGVAKPESPNAKTPDAVMNQEGEFVIDEEGIESAEPVPTEPEPPAALNTEPPTEASGEIDLSSRTLIKPPNEPAPEEPTIIVEEGDIVEPEIIEVPVTATEIGRAEYKKFVATADVASLKKRRTINDPEYATPNEDTFWADPSLGVYAVFDGVGDRGGEAAHAAQETLATYVRSFINPADKLTDKQRGLTQLVSKMNQKIIELSKSKPELSGIGTSLAVVVLHEEKNGDISIITGNVGTSRVYLKEPQKDVVLLTTDDSSRRKRLRELIKNKMDGLTAKSEDRIVAAWENARTSADFQTLNPTEASVAQLLWESYSGPDKALKNSRINYEPQLNFKLERLEKGTNKIILTTEGLNTQITRDELESVVNTLNTPKELAEHLVASADDVTQKRKENYRTVRKKVGEHVSVGDDLTALSIVIEPKK